MSDRILHTEQVGGLTEADVVQTAIRMAKVFCGAGTKDPPQPSK